MTKRLEQAELNLRLEQIDIQLTGQGLPLKYRPLQSFKTIYGTVPDGVVRDLLFEPIVVWFEEKYHEAASWDGVIGRSPVLIRGNVYLLTVPFTSGDTFLKLTDYIEGLPQNVRETFTREEFETIGRRAAASTMSFQKLYDLTIGDGFLDEIERGLVWRALFDLENAANSLRNTGDTQNTIFQSHAAAEKFLKVGIRRSDRTVDLKSLRHDLPKIFGKLSAINGRYAWLGSAVTSLQNFAPNMEIRYSIMERTVENAISAFNAALSICSSLTQMWLFDIERGTDLATFTPNRFFKDGNGVVYRCMEVSTAKTPGVVLRRFGNYALGALMADLSLDLGVSALYLEVTDTKEIDLLRRLYELHMRNRGVQRKPEDLGIQIDSGPEGSYVTGLIEMHKPKKTE